MLLLQLICTFLYRTLHPFPFYPGSLRPFLYSSPFVPSTPYPTTPASGDCAPTRDSQPQHSQGHEACLSPPYVIHSLLSLTPPSRDLHVIGRISPIDSPPHALVSPAAILSQDSTIWEILPYLGSSQITIRSSDLLGNLRTFHLWLQSSDRIPSDLPQIILGSI